MSTITSSQLVAQNSLPPSNERVAFTTPKNYAPRLSHFLHLKHFNPLWCPTVVVETTPHTKSLIKPYLSSSPNPSPLEHFSAIAFTSRTGIQAFSQLLTHDIQIQTPPLKPDEEELFTLAALGKDAELLNDQFLSNLCANPIRIRVLCPPIATPSSLVDSLGFGNGKKVLCPVPLVVGLTEPPVVPNFFRDLEAKDWVPVKLSAYETRWAGPNCAEALVQSEERLDAVVVTSTAEVEGLLKSLRELGFDWEMVKKKWPTLVVAAHGPVTAAGAERLGVGVDVVSSSFGSFEGVVDALVRKLRDLACEG